MIQTDNFTKKVSRKYFKELGVAMLTYAVVLFAAIPIMHRSDDLLARSLIILMPMIPLVFAAVAIYRHILRIDEFQRLRVLKIITISAAGTALFSLGYGFLEIAGLPKLSMMVVWPVMAALWIIAGIVMRVRDR